MIQILGPLSMYFDAVVVEVETFLLLFRLALAILCWVDSLVKPFRHLAKMKGYLRLLKPALEY